MCVPIQRDLSFGHGHGFKTGRHTNHWALAATHSGGTPTERCFISIMLYSWYIECVLRHFRLSFGWARFGCAVNWTTKLLWKWSALSEDGMKFWKQFSSASRSVGDDYKVGGASALNTFTYYKLPYVFRIFNEKRQSAQTVILEMRYWNAPALGWMENAHEDNQNAGAFTLFRVVSFTTKVFCVSRA